MLQWIRTEERTQCGIFNYQGQSREREGVFSSSKRVVAIVIKQNKWYTLKILHAYALTTSYDDEAVDGF